MQIMWWRIWERERELSLEPSVKIFISTSLLPSPPIFTLFVQQLVHSHSGRTKWHSAGRCDIVDPHGTWARHSLVPWPDLLCSLWALPRPRSKLCNLMPRCKMYGSEKTRRVSLSHSVKRDFRFKGKKEKKRKQKLKCTSPSILHSLNPALQRIQATTFGNQLLVHTIKLRQRLFDLGGRSAER